VEYQNRFERAVLRREASVIYKKHMFPVDRGLANKLKNAPYTNKECPMKVLSSLKSAKTRDKDCRVVRRKGRVYVINKKNPRFKARQG